MNIKIYGRSLGPIISIQIVKPIIPPIKPPRIKDNLKFFGMNLKITIIEMKSPIIPRIIGIIPCGKFNI